MSPRHWYYEIWGSGLDLVIIRRHTLRGRHTLKLIVEANFHQDNQILVQGHGCISLCSQIRMRINK